MTEFEVVSTGQDWISRDAVRAINFTFDISASQHSAQGSHKGQELHPGRGLYVRAMRNRRNELCSRSTCSS